MVPALGFAMALQFSPDGRGGWLYRRDQIGAPVPVTAEERDRHIRRFGWVVLFAPLVLFGLVSIYAAIANAWWPDTTDNQGAAVAVVGTGIVFAILYGYLKWFSHAPARTFADRSPVGPAQTRKQVFGRRMQRFTFARLWFGIAAFIILGEVALRNEPGAWWLPIVLFVPIGLGFTWWKWSIDREPG